MKCSDCGCDEQIHSEDWAALMPCAGCSDCHGFRLPKFKFVDEGKTREYFEVTTEAMQYHWGAGSRYLKSAPNQAVGRNGLLWAGEILVSGEWKFVGEFRTGLEARKAVVKAYLEARANGLDSSPN